MINVKSKFSFSSNQLLHFIRFHLLYESTQSHIIRNKFIQSYSSPNFQIRLCEHFLRKRHSQENLKRIIIQFICTAVLNVTNELIREMIGKHRFVIFSRTFCPLSQKCKRLIYNFQDQIKVVDIDQKEYRPFAKQIQTTLESISNSKSIPQIFIDGEFVGRQCPFSDDDALQKLAKCIKVQLPTILLGTPAASIKDICIDYTDQISCISESFRGCNESLSRFAAGVIDEVSLIILNCCTGKKCFILPKKCFPKNSRIRVQNRMDGEYGEIAVEKLNKNYLIESFDVEQNIRYSPFIQWLHKNDDEISWMLKFILSNSTEPLIVSKDHLLLINNEEFVKAYSVKSTDQLSIKINNKLELTNIVSIDYVETEGVYAPLTDDGTIIVNNVAASCYASINDQYTANLFVGIVKNINNYLGIDHQYSTKFYEYIFILSSHINPLLFY
ncbi:hypothetical protein SNEBB_005546 [Seison nebaliae]|nr:hypothetical protein SNEBB_005546 [Seison nebaliae]